MLGLVRNDSCVRQESLVARYLNPLSKKAMNERIHLSSTKPINVVLISRYQIVQESLRLLIDSSRGLSIAGTFSFTEDLSQLRELSSADVAVVYVSSGDPVEIISDLLKQKPGIPVVLIIASADLDSQADALKLGAVGIVHKEQNPKLLIEAIRQTYNGETWLNQVLLNKILEKGKSTERGSGKSHFHMDVDSLTVRELEVVKMIGEGLKNKSIADRLSISEATVRHHLSSIYGKVGVEDRLNLVIFAYQKGLIKLTDQSGVLPAELIDGI
ncbi:MAG: response regulator transcription factor [Acidobacteria bacterium]|nr:response regulator transcription factor [Acidobacteriota bacterium]